MAHVQGYVQRGSGKTMEAFPEDFRHLAPTIRSYLLPYNRQSHTYGTLETKLQAVISFS